MQWQVGAYQRLRQAQFHDGYCQLVVRRTGLLHPAMTLAAIDRPSHHATIFETNAESDRRIESIDRKRNSRHIAAD
jgi:hypothetical protein